MYSDNIVKICFKCSTRKPLDQFYYHAANKDKLLNKCKECTVKDTTEWGRKNKQKRCTYGKSNYRKNRDGYIRDWRLKKDYNISLDEYNKIFESQKGKCFICDLHQALMKYKLCVDHDHKTGKVRGLLCRKCNSALGLFSDSKNKLMRAISYLDKQTIEEKAA